MITLDRNCCLCWDCKTVFSDFLFWIFHQTKAWGCKKYVCARKASKMSHWRHFLLLYGFIWLFYCIILSLCEERWWYKREWIFLLLFAYSSEMLILLQAPVYLLTVFQWKNLPIFQFLKISWLICTLSAEMVIMILV